jgi:hypothetical protein
MVAESYMFSDYDLFTLTFLSSVSLSRFPNLREIQLPGLRWPATEFVAIPPFFHRADMFSFRFDILNSCWPECSERLAKKNVMLTDKNGCHWRPRLERQFVDTSVNSK